jgi:hypothetical protein
MECRSIMTNLVATSMTTMKPKTIPAPLGGLNVFDNLAQMPPTDAIKIINLVPQPYGCTVRKGYQVHASGITGPVSTIGSWINRTGQTKLFAFGDHKMFDITAPGPVSAPIVSTLNNNYWQFVGFANSAGTHTVFMNGTDDPIWYNVGGVQRLIAGDGLAANTIKNVNPALFIQGTVHQRRLWFVPVNDTRGWFLEPDSVYGIASFFDFGPFFKRGGYLSTLATWSVDSGEGSNDKLVAVSSNGEAAVFAGTDPATASTWALVGTFFIGSPINGRRYFTNIAGDLLYLTSTGLVSMASTLVSTQVNQAANNVYSKKIQFLLSDLTTTLAEVEGWEIEFLPAINLLLINIPTIYAGSNGQLVNNVTNNAWCTFTGMDATCWHRLSTMPYFGDINGKVYRAWIGDKDNVELDGSGGTNILAKCQQAYIDFDAPTMQKQIGLYRPVFMGARKAGYTSKIIYDYLSSEIRLPSGSVAKSAVALWGEALWGEGKWSGGYIVQRDWASAEGMGFALSLALNLTTEVETTWIATDFTIRSGGVL